MIYLELLAVAAVAVYIVDPRLSGFTNSWRAALARILHVRELRPLKPFDCPKCMAWWSCVVYALAGTSGASAVNVPSFTYLIDTASSRAILSAPGVVTVPSMRNV